MWWFRFAVVPVEDGAHAEVVGIDSVLTLARNCGEMGELFGRFCRTNLCMESWDFIVDVIHYETKVGLQ